MDPTQPGRIPPSGPPKAYCMYPGRTQKLSRNQNATSGPKRPYEMTDLGTYEAPRRRKEYGGTMATTNLRPGLLDVAQPTSMTGTNQQYQRPRQDSIDSLYSGAIEGCSRDHHPECYPELWGKTNKPITNGHNQHREFTGPAKQLRTPPEPLAAPSNRSFIVNGNVNPGGYRDRVKRSFSRKFPPKTDAGKVASANVPSRKGKGSPLTLEDRLFFLGVRPRLEGDGNESSNPNPPPPAAPAPSSDKGPVIGGFVTYPQTGGFHDPSRASGSPLVVANPDPGSEAERVRDDAVRGERASRIGRRWGSHSRSKAKGSRGGLLPKYCSRLF